MASQQTPNYKLSRWAGTDRILMEDFNADNAKIDAAIAGRLGPIEEIKRMTLSDPSNLPTLDLSGMDLSRWSLLALSIWPVSSAASDASYQFTLNNTDGNPSSYIHKQPEGEMLHLFFPRRSGENKATVLTLPGGSLSRVNCTFASLKGIALGGPRTFTSGTTLTLYGIR